MFLDEGSLIASKLQFTGNLAQSKVPGSVHDASGGALSASVDTTTQLTRSLFVGNEARLWRQHGLRRRPCKLQQCLRGKHRDLCGESSVRPGRRHCIRGRIIPCERHERVAINDHRQRSPRAHGWPRFRRGNCLCQQPQGQPSESDSAQRRHNQRPRPLWHLPEHVRPRRNATASFERQPGRLAQTARMRLASRPIPGSSCQPRHFGFSRPCALA